MAGRRSLKYIAAEAISAGCMYIPIPFREPERDDCHRLAPIECPAPPCSQPLIYRRQHRPFLDREIVFYIS